jgi:hypothetical protein
MSKPKNAIESMVENTPIIKPVKCDIKTLETLRESVAEKTAGAVHVVKQYADTLCAYFSSIGVKDWISEAGRLADNETIKNEKTAFITACEKRSHANPSKAWADVLKYAKRALYGITDKGTNPKLPFTDSLIKDFRAIETRLQSDKNKSITQQHIDIITKFIRPAIDALKKIG